MILSHAGRTLMTAFWCGRVSKRAPERVQLKKAIARDLSRRWKNNTTHVIEGSEK